METTQLTAATNSVISPEQLLKHWQGHRSLTRKIIDQFPADKLFDYSIGGMRPFGEMVVELIDLAAGGISGIASGEWKSMADLGHVSGEIPKTKEEILQIWDKVTEEINEIFPQVSIERFQQVEMAFGAYEGANYATLLYIIENEVHHRGQAYVYLRSLGITPTPFWERD